MVLNVQVQLQPNTTSVRVAWKKINVPAISSYIVYYSTEGESEQFRSVPSSENSVLIMDLRSDVEYEFQVVAIGTVNKQEILGKRSTMVILSPATLPLSQQVRNTATAVSIAVLIAILLLLMGWAITCCRIGPSRKK